MSNEIVIITFYKFVTIEDTDALRETLTDFCEECHIKGTILIAPEGINSTIAGTRPAIDGLLALLRDDARFSNLVHKESYADYIPFDRMKVKLKKEIVTFKQPDIDPNATVGTYVEPDEWNHLISDPDVVVIDTRNDFEVSIGTFKGAINPKTDAFSDLPEFVAHNLDPNRQKRVAMFCTGGIRCEKATAYMLKQGFEEVYHLNGGILRYLENMPKDRSLWEGECFVFDNRVSVDHDLQPGEAYFCPECKALVKHVDDACPQCGYARDKASDPS